MKISARIIPNSSRTEIVSFVDGILRIKVAVPAVDGRANEAVIDFLRKKLKIKTILLVKGFRARNKVIDFGDDFSEEQILDMLLGK